MHYKNLKTYSLFDSKGRLVISSDNAKDLADKYAMYDRKRQERV